MIETKIVKSRGVGCIRQALIAILIFVLVVAGFVGLVLLSTSLPLTNNQRVYLWLGGFALSLLLVIGGILIWNNRLIQRRTAQLEAAFTPTGLTGRGYLWNGRQYHGIIRGHQVDIYFYRGPSLDMYLAAPVNTRMAIGLKSRFSRMASASFGRPELVIHDPELAHLGFYPLDEAWGRAVVEDRRGKTAILQLTTVGPGLEFRNLLFQPEAIHLQIHRIDMSTITAQNIHTWVAGLLDLAEVAASLPAPLVTAPASAMERRTRLNRGDFTLPLVGLTCGIIGFFAALMIIVAILFLNLGKGGF